MIIEKFPEVRNLSADDKWLLAEELWEELVPEPDAERDEAIQKLIEARMEDYRRNPQSAVSWETVKQKMQALRPSKLS